MALRREGHQEYVGQREPHILKLELQNFRVLKCGQPPYLSSVLKDYRKPGRANGRYRDARGAEVEMQ